MIIGQSTKQEQARSCLKIGFPRWLRTFTAAVTALLLVSAPIAFAATEFSVGNVSGNTYSNEYLGITCTLDDDWSFGPDSDLAGLNGIEESQQNEEYLSEACEETPVFLMEAGKVTDEGAHIVLLSFRKLTGLQAFVDYTDSMMEEILEASTETGKGNIEAAGVTDVSYKLTTVNFLGESMPAMLYEGNYMGLPYYEMVIMKRFGEGLICIDTTSIGEEPPSEVWEKYITEIEA